MVCTRSIWPVCVGLLIVLAFGPALSRAELTTGEDFEADEAVEALTVWIAVGAGGEDLAEPLVLDLGLGFPLWLHPLGREAGTVAPFGAVPRETTASRAVGAGQTADFAFYLHGAPGQDPLQTSPLLLDGVQVSDISRIGFASQGTSNWVLGGYEIAINGKLFAVNDAVSAAVGPSQEAARFRLAEIHVEIAPLEAEVEDLRALIQAGLASDGDRERFREVVEQLVPLLKEQNRRQRQTEGSYPWFEETEFHSPWRSGDTIEDLKVTLLTYPHSGADTRNYVYYRTGGHKYLLSSPMNPLAPEYGQQEFYLDLLAGPLTAADLRGHAVGMLAHEQPFGEAPDRWHPQRLLVEVDGRVVYDSEETPIDRMSLETIRVIPPVHVDHEGNAVGNIPNARETYVWEAGMGIGLDLVNGGAAALPEPDDEGFPEPEPGLVIDESGFEPEYVIPIEEDYYDDVYFPGEECFDDNWDVYGCDEWEPWYDECGWNDVWIVDGEPGWDPGWEPGWEPPPSWMDVLIGLLEDLLGPGGGGVWPDVFDEEDEAEPAGEPLQIEDLAFEGDFSGDITIRWDAHGDESYIAQYQVDVLLVRPHEDPAFDAGSMIWTTTVDVGIHEAVIPAAEASAILDAVGVGVPEEELPLLYVAPWVAPVLVADSEEPNPPGQLGAARPLLPSFSPLMQPIGDAVFTYASGSQTDAFVIQPEPDHGGRAVWFDTQLASHNGIRFEDSNPGFHLAVRPLEESDHVEFTFQSLLPNARYCLVAHTGFSGGSDAANSADVAMEYSVYPIMPPGPPVQHQRLEAGPWSPVGGPPQPLVELQSDFINVGPLPHRIIVTFEVERGALDPLHPPALFGLRLVQMP